jgi:UDP-N-acetylmuramyl pentapeptide phosphotransferase/UDP-N-acetylglucosamine-1-phosphate transferase
MLLIELALSGFLISVLTVAACILTGPQQGVSQRSSHERPTAIGGGLGVLAAVASVILIARGQSVVPGSALLGVFFLQLALHYAMGLVDDLIELRASLRFFIMAFGATFWVALVPSLSGLSFASGIVLPLSAMAFVGCAAVFLVGFANFVNFMDGANGLVGSTTLIAFLAIALFALFEGLTTLTVLGLGFAVGIGGFLVFNWRSKAAIFLGDTGSIPIGFGLGAMLIWLAAESTHAGMVWICGLIVAPLIVDPLLTLAWRFKQGHNLAEAHRHHAYQRWIKSGKSHVWVASRYAGFSFGSFCVANLVYLNSPAPLDEASFAFLALVVCTIAMIIHWFFAPWPDGERGNIRARKS